MSDEQSGDTDRQTDRDVKEVKEKERERERENETEREREMETNAVTLRYINIHSYCSERQWRLKGFSLLFFSTNKDKCMCACVTLCVCVSLCVCMCVCGTVPKAVI